MLYKALSSVTGFCACICLLFSVCIDSIEGDTNTCDVDTSLLQLPEPPALSAVAAVVKKLWRGTPTVNYPPMTAWILEGEKASVEAASAAVAAAATVAAAKARAEAEGHQSADAESRAQPNERVDDKDEDGDNDAEDDDPQEPENKGVKEEPEEVGDLAPPSCPMTGI